MHAATHTLPLMLHTSGMHTMVYVTVISLLSKKLKLVLFCIGNPHEGGINKLTVVLLYNFM